MSNRGRLTFAVQFLQRGLGTWSLAVTTLLALLLAIAGGLTLSSAALDRRLRSEIGLIQTLYSTPDFQGPPLLRRRVSTLDLSWIGSDVNPPTRFFSVRWEGFWDVRHDGTVDIYAGGDDQVLVFVDGELVLERNARLGRRTISRTLRLAEGVHRLKLEYVQHRGAARFNVQWAPSGERARPFVPERLFGEEPSRETLSTARRAEMLRRGGSIAWTTFSIAFACVCGALSIGQWKRLRVNDHLSRMARWGGASYIAWAERYARVGRIVFAIGVGAVTLSAGLARLPGWNPESLWQDDLVWAAITRAQDLRTMLSLPTHAPPGFFVMLWGTRTLFGDPEWSLQLLPFVSGIVAIPAMALVVWKLTRSEGLALLAAALAALNPLLAHYTVFVKPYSFDFLITALLLFAAASMLDGREVHPRKFAGFSVLSAVGLFFSATSVFSTFSIVNVVALRAWSARRRGAASILVTAGVFNLLFLLAYLALRNRANERVIADFRSGFMPLRSPSSIWTYLSTQGRRLIETSLPSWKETQIWNPETVSWMLPLVGLGLVSLLARRSTRAMGWIVLGFYGSFLVASGMRVYPLGINRTDIFAFPVAICLAAAGVQLLTEWIPRREIVRAALGLTAAGFALYAPVRAEYWAVNDARLIRHLTAEAVPDDGLILSPNGGYLAASYGTWPVVISATSERTNATEAEIARDLTVHLPPNREPKPVVDKFLAESRPARIWYVAFRTREEEEVLRALTEQGYVLELVERTSIGSLYLGLGLRG